MSPTWIFCSLHLAGAAVYGLSVLFFVVLLSLAGTDEVRRARHRRFLSWGPVLGLSMGALIAGGIGLYYQQNGAFVWGTETHAALVVGAEIPYADIIAPDNEDIGLFCRPRRGSDHQCTQKQETISQTSHANFFHWNIPCPFGRCQL